MGLVKSQEQEQARVKQEVEIVLNLQGVIVQPAQEELSAPMEEYIQLAQEELLALMEEYIQLEV